MRIKQADLQPPLVIDLTDNGLALDLTDATSVRVVGVRGYTQVINDPSPNLGADLTLGRVTHTWVVGETGAVGRIFVNVIVTWSGGRTQTFPPYGSLAVDVGAGELLPV